MAENWLTKPGFWKEGRANRQSLAFSERNQLSQAIPQFHVERILHQRTPIAQFSNRNATNAGSTRTKYRVFRGRYDRQRTLVIRIAAITLASDSAITIARFRPSKVLIFPRRNRNTHTHTHTKLNFLYYEARNDYTNNSETVLLCNRCVCV